MAIVQKVKIDAPVEKVWEALTDKEQMKQWYFTIPDFQLKEGTEFNFYEPGDEKKFHHKCVITEIKPLERFQHTWTHPSQSKGTSVVTWDLVSDGNTTDVQLTHEGLENFGDAGADFTPENYEAGWKEIVGNSLKGFVEKGESPYV